MTADTNPFHAERDCDESCAGCPACYLATGDTVCARRCAHWRENRPEDAAKADASVQPPFCAECGAAMFVTETSVSHHADPDTADGIDYEADADHVAFALDAAEQARAARRMTRTERMQAAVDAGLEDHLEGRGER